jgi:hypothetical protein
MRGFKNAFQLSAPRIVVLAQLCFLLWHFDRLDCVDLPFPQLQITLEAINSHLSAMAEPGEDAPHSAKFNFNTEVMLMQVGSWTDDVKHESEVCHS